MVHIFTLPREKEAAAIPTICTNTSELDLLSGALSSDQVLNVGQSNAPAVIFMRGHQPPECLTRIGALCNIHPLFFQRHLEYRWASRPLKLFSSPALPSAFLNILRLRIVTFGEREKNANMDNASQIQTLRTKGANAMTDYLHDLNREYQLIAGNSIVRAFNVHNARYFSIEQEVTITVQAIGNRWLGHKQLSLYVARY